MAKKIVILDTDSSEPTHPTVRFVLWFPVASAYQPIYANPTASSSVKGITGSELAAIQSGQVVEFVDHTEINPVWTIPQIKTHLIVNYNNRFTAFSASSGNYLRYGVSWDGTNWSA